jgi:hypothetical protein
MTSGAHSEDGPEQHELLPDGAAQIQRSHERGDESYRSIISPLIVGEKRLVF